MRHRIKQRLPFFAVAALLFLAWPPAGVLAAEATADIPVIGQINGKQADVPPSPDQPEVPDNQEKPAIPVVSEKAVSAGTMVKTNDASDMDLWLIVAPASLLMVILLLLWRENQKTIVLKRSEVK